MHFVVLLFGLATCSCGTADVLSSDEDESMSHILQLRRPVTGDTLQFGN
jgi:hypothetical protein